ncbi:MAG: hypothetical protein IPL13_18560 [Saprospiraceae bacterium]|nr:hypothetical protein [Candidatus Brachybacter algidus]
MKVLSFSQQGSRNYQQDNLYISEEKQIFAVCDGVGGSADGFLASNMVVNSLQSQYPGHATLHDKDSIGDYLFDVLSAFRHDQFEEIATTMTFLTIVGPTAFYTTLVIQGYFTSARPQQVVCDERSLLRSRTFRSRHSYFRK